LAIGIGRYLLSNISYWNIGYQYIINPYGLVSSLCYLSIPCAASEHYCHELKLQLQRTSQQVEELQQRLTATKTELETAREQLQNYKDRMVSVLHTFSKMKASVSMTTAPENTFALPLPQLHT